MEQHCTEEPLSRGVLRELLSDEPLWVEPSVAPPAVQTGPAAPPAVQC